MLTVQGYEVSGMRFIAMIGWAMCAVPTGAAGDPPQPETHRFFQPVVRPKVPEVRAETGTAVDRFIVAVLEAKGFTLNPEADRPTLIRRVALDLTGVPPTV